MTEKMIDLSVPLGGWQNFYSKVFGIGIDFSTLKIPKRQEDFDRLIVMVQGMKNQRLYDKCQELFPCWKYTGRSLDETVPTNDRSADKASYAIWIRDRIEADEKWEKVPAGTLKSKGILGITLAERLLYELKFFRETEKIWMFGI